MDFTVPAQMTACVPQGVLRRPDGYLSVEPTQVKFGEIDPDDLQSNFAPLQITNAVDDLLMITAISCTPLDGTPQAVSPWFVIQLGETGDAARVAYVLRPLLPAALHGVPRSSFCMVLVCEGATVRAAIQ